MYKRNLHEYLMSNGTLSLSQLVHMLKFYYVWFSCFGK